jgi:hypothetical protein
VTKIDRSTRWTVFDNAVLMTGLLTILKLNGWLAWSWWLVLSPLWVYAVGWVLVFVVLVVLLALLAAAIDEAKAKGGQR